MLLFDLHRGSSPLVVDVPHAGTYVPDALALRMTPAARALPDTDWHVEKLYAFARDTEVTLMVATHSRYVVDLNRDPSGAALYPGADNTELCPTRTFANEAIYAGDDLPGTAEIDARRRTYFEPYHAALAQEIARVRDRHGYVILLDGHSIRSEVPRFFAGRLPALNLGTADGASCAADVAAVATRVLASGGFTHIVNGRFKGGYVTRRYGRPQDDVHALQLEMAQDAYMDEAPPYAWEPARAKELAAMLESLVITLAETRPQRSTA
ncbi:MAG TPA: N-formylglutamate deformylase [Casimicrobiaceae bacterium]|nr:N-formylglutamate deformylase [Casimicrobiaceae bacterium]